jgi:hypothetical protein
VAAKPPATLTSISTCWDVIADKPDTTTRHSANGTVLVDVEALFVSNDTLRAADQAKVVADQMTSCHGRGVL